MKAIMISVKPEWCEKICNYKKTIEIRKTMPKCELPIKVYIYCTGARKYFFHNGIGETLDDLYRLPKNADYDGGKIKFGYSGELMCCGAEYDKNNFLNGKVVAEFTLKKVDTIETTDPYIIRDGKQEDWWWFKENACLDSEQIMEYIGYGDEGEYSKGYAWHIDDLKIYDEPKRLSEFEHYISNNKCPKKESGTNCEDCKSYNKEHNTCLALYYLHKQVKRPPQSWCYVKELREGL